MRGLIIKDLYMAKKYCRNSLILNVIFIAISLVGNSNLFFIFYPCMICGMIPITLLAYDEKSKWLQYSATMPYTRAQIVSGKYIIGLVGQVAMIIITGVAQAVRMNVQGIFIFKEYLVLMMLLLIMSFVSSSMCLPFMFKLGVEKGRAAYYSMIGLVCAGSVVSSTYLLKDAIETLEINSVLPILCLVSIGIYALSWYLSIVFYKKRDL